MGAVWKSVLFCLRMSNKICSIFRLTDAVLPVRSVLVTIVAEALEGAQSVDTLSVPAHLALEGAALIDVCKVNPENVSVPSRLGPSLGRRAASLPMQSLLCVSSKPGKQRQL